MIFSLDGLLVDLQASWAAAVGMVAATTCKRTWAAKSGGRGDSKLDAHHPLLPSDLVR